MICYGLIFLAAFALIIYNLYKLLENKAYFSFSLVYIFNPGIYVTIVLFNGVIKDILSVGSDTVVIVLNLILIPTQILTIYSAIKPLSLFFQTDGI